MDVFTGLTVTPVPAAVPGLIPAAPAAGRCLHAFGFGREGAHFIWRSSGMILTFAVLIGASVRPALTAPG